MSPSVLCSRVIFSLSFSLKPRVSILVVMGGCQRRNHRGRSKRATARATLFCRQNPQGSFSTMWLQRKSCPANDKGEMESLPQQLLYSGRKSPHFLACACFPFCSEPSLVSGEPPLPWPHRELWALLWGVSPVTHFFFSFSQLSLAQQLCVSRSMVLGMSLMSPW